MSAQLVLDILYILTIFPIYPNCVTPSYMCNPFLYPLTTRPLSVTPQPLLPALDGIRNDTASTLVLAFILEILRLGLRHLAHTQR